MTDKEKKPGRLTMFLLAMIVPLLIANLLATSLLLAQNRAAALAASSSLPCEAVPVRFVLDAPECADKLLRSMNVTNVRVLLRKPLAGNKSTAGGVGDHGEGLFAN